MFTGTKAIVLVTFASFTSKDLRWPYSPALSIPVQNHLYPSSSSISCLDKSSSIQTYAKDNP